MTSAATMLRGFTDAAIVLAGKLPLSIGERHFSCATAKELTLWLRRTISPIVALPGSHSL